MTIFALLRLGKPGLAEISRKIRQNGYQFFLLGNALIMAEKRNICDGSDLLTDAAAWRGGYISRLEKRYGCELRFSNVDDEASRALGRRKGRYCTISGKDAARALAYAMKRTSEAKRALVVGLGNASFVSDALGASVVDALRRLDASREFMTLLPEVKAVTGLDSADIVAAVVAKSAPDLVIVADALATTDWRKVGACFQLTTAGIRPGSGMGEGGRCIDEEYIGAKVLAIGVPLICVSDGGERRQVIPYDAENVVKESAIAIAAAIFAAYS